MPVLNKIDLKNADIESAQQQLKKLFDFDSEEILKVSAKTGLGTEQLLNSIIENIPAPKSTKTNFKAVVFDLWYEKFKGIILLIRILDGKLQVGDHVISSTNLSKVHVVKELNILHPTQISAAGNPPTLYAGQVGVIVANIHDNEEIKIGDLLFHNNEDEIEVINKEKDSKTKLLKSNPMVYASIYPCEKSNYLELNKSLQKLLLNDNSVEISKEGHPVLGNGFKYNYFILFLIKRLIFF